MIYLHNIKGTATSVTVPSKSFNLFVIRIYFLNWNLETKSCIDVACADNS